MLAVVMRSFGGPGVLRTERVALPEPGPGEVLIRVGAVEVSTSRDIAVRSGAHPCSQQLKLPHVLGGDAAGVVCAVGPGVDTTLAGRRVAMTNPYPCEECDACLAAGPETCTAPRMIGIHRWGTYAEYAVAPASCVHPIPHDIGFAQGAALAATGPVALTQLRTADLSTGDFVLVTGASGALATTIFALASALDLHAVALSRRPDEVVGAQWVVDLRTTETSADILQASDDIEPAAAIDNVCKAETFGLYFPTLRNGARIVVSGAFGREPILPVPARDLYGRSIGLLGVRSHTAAAAAEFWALVDAGFRLGKHLVHEYPMTDVAGVHLAVQTGRTAGHTVVTMPWINTRSR